jgi:hypothetical protein
MPHGRCNPDHRGGARRLNARAAHLPDEALKIVMRGEGVNGLSIAMLRPLYEQRHEQRGDSGNAMPAEVTRLEREPEHRVKKDRANRPWSR